MNFFIVPEDWPRIDDFLKEVGASVIDSPVINKDQLFPGERNEARSSQVYLTNDRCGEKIVLNAHDQGYYVDIVKSNVIEFSRGGFYPYSDKILHRARLYTVSTYYDGNGQLVDKETAFLEWAARLYKLFKKEFLAKTAIDKTYLFSENAVKWILQSKAILDTAGLTAYANDAK
jgi:hypothetical protein